MKQWIIKNNRFTVIFVSQVLVPVEITAFDLKNGVDLPALISEMENHSIKWNFR